MLVSYKLILLIFLLISNFLSCSPIGSKIDQQLVTKVSDTNLTGVTNNNGGSGLNQNPIPTSTPIVNPNDVGNPAFCDTYDPWGPLVNDPMTGCNWAMKNVGQKISLDMPLPTSGAKYFSNFGNETADFNFTSEILQNAKGNIPIRITDDSFAKDHNDLSPRYDPSLNIGCNPSDNTEHPQDLSNGNFGTHGIMVSGLAGATGNNNYGSHGIYFLPVKSLGYMNIFYCGNLNPNGSAWSTAVPISAKSKFGTSRAARVINASWGSSEFIHEEMIPEYQNFWDNYQTSITTDKTVFVKAAGNSRQQIVDTSSDATSLHPLVLNVAALMVDGTFANYSNFGSGNFLSGFAGVGSNSQDPGSCTTDISNYPTSTNGHTFTCSMNGTSAAAPNVTGVVAHLLDVHPEFTVADVLYVLMKSAFIPASAQVSSTSLPISFAANQGGQTVMMNGSFQIPAPLAANGNKFIHLTTNDASLRFSTDYGFGIPRIKEALDFANSYTAGKSISMNPLSVTSSPNLTVPANSCQNFNLNTTSSGKIWSVELALQATSNDQTSTARMWHYTLKHLNTEIDIRRPKFCVTLANQNFPTNDSTCDMSKGISLTQKSKAYGFLDMEANGGYVVKFCNYSPSAATIQSANLKIYVQSN